MFAKGCSCGHASAILAHDHDLRRGREPDGGSLIRCAPRSRITKFRAASSTMSTGRTAGSRGSCLGEDDRSFIVGRRQANQSRAPRVDRGGLPHADHAARSKLSTTAAVAVWYSTPSSIGRGSGKGVADV